MSITMQFPEVPPDIHYKASHICDGLYVGSTIASNDLEHLRQEDITVVIRVIMHEEHCLEEYPGIEYHYYSTYDGPCGDIIGAFEYTRDIIRNALREGRRVLVHCRAGKSRSAAVVIGYLMWSRGIDYHTAYAIVCKARCIADPCSFFVTKLSQYQMPPFSE